MGSIGHPDLSRWRSVGNEDAGIRRDMFSHSTRVIQGRICISNVMLESADASRWSIRRYALHFEIFCRALPKDSSYGVSSNLQGVQGMVSLTTEKRLNPFLLSRCDEEILRWLTLELRERCFPRSLCKQRSVCSLRLVEGIHHSEHLIYDINAYPSDREIGRCTRLRCGGAGWSWPRLQKRSARTMEALRSTECDSHKNSKKSLKSGILSMIMCLAVNSSARRVNGCDESSPS